MGRARFCSIVSRSYRVLTVAGPNRVTVAPEIENEGGGRLGGMRKAAPDSLRFWAMRGAGPVWERLPHRQNPQAARGESLS